MHAHFIVHAKVVDAAAKSDFDFWYRNEHLPDALKLIVAEFERAWGDKVACSRDFLEVIQTFAPC